MSIVYFIHLIRNLAYPFNHLIYLVELLMFLLVLRL